MGTNVNMHWHLPSNGMNDIILPIGKYQGSESIFISLHILAGPFAPNNAHLNEQGLWLASGFQRRFLEAVLTEAWHCFSGLLEKPRLPFAA